MSEPENGATEQHGNSPWLKPYAFQPGQSGNPLGRPKGTVSLRAALQARIRDDPALVDQITQSLLDIAADDDSKDQLKAIELIHDANDGKQAQPVEIDVPIVFRDNPANMRALPVSGNGNGDGK